MNASSVMKLTASIDGMTCSSCSKTIENVLKGLKGVHPDSISVSLTTSTVTVLYDLDVVSSNLIIGSIVEVGFDAVVLNESKIKSSVETDSKSLLNLVLAIDGMTCSSCIETVENACRNVNGVVVSSVVVSLSTNSAKLFFDSSEVTSKKIVEEIRAVGFDVKILSESKYKSNEDVEGIEKESVMKTVLLSLREPNGRTFTSAEIQSKLETLQASILRTTDIENGDLHTLGVDSVELILCEAQVKVAFDDTLIGPRDFVAIAESLHLEVSVSSFGGFLMASRLLARQEKESKEFLRLVQLALLLTVPVVLVSMIFPMMGKFDSILSASFRPGVTYSSIFLLIFTFPVEFVVGYRFHKKAYQSLKTGSMGMDFMISTGTLAAYFYSVIGMVRSGESGDSSIMMTSSYFDTSAVLITAVLLGKYLELYARGQTASAIHKLTGLKAKTARLVGCLPQDLYESMEKVDSVISSSASNGYLPLNGNVEQVIDASLLHKYDVIRLVAGESIPADGVLLEGGHLGVDESMMTGESAMVTKKSKDFLYGGTTVVEGSALMRVTALGDDSVLGKILSTVQEAQTSKPPIQEFADKVARYFVPVVACISVMTLLGWIIVAVMGTVPNSWYEKEGSPYLLAFYFALSVWVSACPCAFGLATPTAVLVATGIAAKHGILVRRGAALQFAAEVNTVAFDKTGTLTKGCTEVSDFQFIDAKDGSVVKLPYYSVSEDGIVKEDFNIGLVVRTSDNYDDLLYILRLLLAAEVRSSHPLAKGLTAYCKQAITSLSLVVLDKTEGQSSSPRILPSENALVFDVVPGQGVHMHSNAGNPEDFSEPHLSVLVGSPKLLEEHGIPIPNLFTQIANGYRVGGKVALFLSVNGALRAVMGVSDAVRPEALHVIAALKKRGIQCFMVTGDEPTTARAIGVSVGIPSACILASAKPEDKEQFIAALQTSSLSRIAFVGDGTNDSPALARANVGFTMASGSDIALEAGDMVLCRNDLRDLLTALKLSRQTLSKIRVNYVWAFAYNLLLIPLASGILFPVLHFALSPMLAGAAMALSSVSVVVSSLLLFLFTPSSVGGGETKRARIESTEENDSSGSVELLTLNNTGGEHTEKLVQCNCPVSVVEMVDNYPSSFLSSLGMISEHFAFQEIVEGPTAVEILATYKEEKLKKQNFVGYSKQPESETKNILMRNRSLRNRRTVRERKDATVGQGCGCGKGNCKCGEGCKCGGSR